MSAPARDNYSGPVLTAAVVAELVRQGLSGQGLVDACARIEAGDLMVEDVVSRPAEQDRSRPSGEVRAVSRAAARQAAEPGARAKNRELSDDQALFRP